MKREVSAAVGYLQRLVEARSNLNEAAAQLFAEKLQKLLCDKYNDHWYPDCPSKGQAYRCIRINNGVVCDDVLLNACKESDITPSELCLPPEITLWIDPMEVCARSREHCRPFTIARFNKESSSVGARTPDHTSDYHSATSSSCSSTSSSDNEEEAKDGETEQRKGEDVANNKKADADACAVVMVPRIRKRYGDGQNRTKYVRNTLPASLQYYYSPAPAWPHYKKATPVYLTVCPAPPQPPPPQQVFGYYILPQQPPQFIVPQASLHPWGPVMN